MRREPMRLAWSAAAVLGAIVAGGAVWAAARGWPMRKDGDYLIVETPHYQFKTDHSPETAQLAASHQEALFQELYRRMSKTRPVAQIKRMLIVIIQDNEKYNRLVGSRGENTQGLYTGMNISLWGPPDEVDGILETLRHEGTHQFMEQFIGATCPVWLHEGMAVYFQTARFVKGQLEVGQVPIQRLNLLKGAMKDGKLLPLTRLLGMTTDEWSAAVKSKSAQSSIQYQEAWALVHFLEEGEGGKYRAPFLQYLYFLSRGEPSMRAWEKTFGANIPAFEQRFRAYLGALKPSGGFDCRTKMQLLGYLILRAEKRPDLLKDINTFREAAVGGAFGGYTLTVAGEEISVNDPEGIADLFRCSEDRSKGDAPSYELVHVVPGQLPILRCTRHPGYIVETVYEKDPDDPKRRVVKIVSRPNLPGAKKSGADAAK